MPNWKRIKELRDDLDRPWDPKAFRFSMGTVLGPENARATVGQMREGQCGTACCLAGSAILMFHPNDNGRVALYFFGQEGGPDWEDIAGELCGLTKYEAAFMFYGQWSTKGLEATQEEAVRYLDKVLKEKNVMVRL